MKIGLSSDHGGFELKRDIKEYFEENKIEYIDLGTDSEASVDYPEYGERAALAVVNGKCDKAIIACGTGIGISIAANKVPGIRCALVSDVFSARMSRQHNNSNILALGGRVIGKCLAFEIIDVWLNTEFEGGRHEKRVDKITQIEDKYLKR